MLLFLCFQPYSFSVGSGNVLSFSYSLPSSWHHYKICKHEQDNLCVVCPTDKMKKGSQRMTKSNAGNLLNCYTSRLILSLCGQYFTMFQNGSARKAGVLVNFFFCKFCRTGTATSYLFI